jgi:hypothetical protein
MTAPIIIAPADEAVVLHIPAYRRDDLDHKLAIANRRLERGGVDGRFSYVAVPVERKIRKGAIELPDGTLFGGTEVVEPWLDITLDALKIGGGDHTFVAALVGEEAGYTVHCAPGQSLDGWVRPPVDDIHCDHCGLKRDRRRIYIVRDDRDGKLLQVGHSCIELYTGLKIKGLWALEFGKELRGWADEDTGGGFGDRDYGAPVDKVLALAFAFADEGRSYVSIKAAEAGVGDATGGLVRSALFFPPRPPRSGASPREHAAYEDFLAKVRLAEVFVTDAALIAGIREAADTLEAGTDYGDNMKVILAGEYVSGRNVGILASLVAVYAREKELAVKREQEAKSPPAKGFLAAVKVRVRDLELALRTVKSWEGQWGWTTLLVGRSADGHTVKWFASGSLDLEPGDTLFLKAATVKAHEVYEGVDQTVITRGVIDHDKMGAVV